MMFALTAYLFFPVFKAKQRWFRENEIRSESDTDSESCPQERHKCSNENSSTSESDSEEVWSEMLSRDIVNPPPLPEAQHRETSRKKSLVFWFVYFLLIWQATCHLSDNGLVWLLKFLVSWLKSLGVEISSEVFENLLLIFSDRSTL